MEENKFPYGLTEFIKKVDAKYDGDPKGDYVLAEHVNDVQDAINRIEKTLGIKKTDNGTIEERIEKISTFDKMTLSSVGYFQNLESPNIEFVKTIAQKYEIVILGRESSNTKELSKDVNLYGRVYSKNIELKEVQAEIGKWKNLGAKGIYLDSLSQNTREKEISIYNSVLQEGLKVIVSGDFQRLLSNDLSNYNQNQVEFPFKKDTILLFNEFGYSQNFEPDNYVSNSYILNTLLPFTKKAKKKNLKIMISSDVSNRKSFLFVHTLGLLLSLDYIYAGSLAGSTLMQQPYTYETGNIISQWRTDNPSIFEENGSLKRNVLNGSIIINKNKEVYFPGLLTDSELIKWNENTIDGAANKISSIPPDRLTTYDIKKIVDLINKASNNILIDPGKIDSEDTSGLLPESIGASHMYSNVIKAINMKNNINTEQEQYIEDSAILELSSNKLTGSINTTELIENIIKSINLSSTTTPSTSTNYIDVSYANINSIKGTGTVDYPVFVGESATFNQASVPGILEAGTANITTKINAPSAEIDSIVANTITTSKLDGLTTLKIENLEAGNIESLVLNVIDLKASSGYFNKIVTESLKADTVVTEIIDATTSYSDFSVTDKAKINQMIAKSMTAQYGFFEELSSSIINTDKLEITSNSGVLNINSDTIKIYDAPGKKQTSDIRILIGNLKEATGNKDDYGFMALDSTGKNKIFDHTGVYEGGIHKDSITTETIKENAVTGGKIKHESINVNHLIGKTIIGDWIAGETISGDKIIGETITAKQLSSLSIDTRHLIANAIEGNHIKGNVIEGQHIKAGAISTEHLKIGFEANLMKDGTDSFEQHRVGEVQLNELNKNITQSFVQKEEAFEGDKVLRASSFTNNGYLHIGKKILVDNYIETEKDFAFSSFIKVPKGSAPTRVKLGFMLSSNSKESAYVNGDFINITNRYIRYSFILKSLSGYTHLTPVIVFESSSDSILMDALQVEAIPAGGEISPWRTTATTIISGDNITTGRIDSKHIKIGDNTIYGDGNIIELTDQGILVKAGVGKSVNIASKGIEVVGGAFSLTGGQGTESVTIDGDTGLIVENNLSKIEVSSKNGLNIFNLKENKVVLRVNSEGNLQFSGTAEFLSSDNKKMSIDFYEQQKEIERQKEAELEQAQKLATHQQTIDTQKEILQREREKIRLQEQEVIKRKQEISKERMLKRINSTEQHYSLNLEMKVGYNGYNSRQASSLYFHGYKLNETTNEYEPADINGELINLYTNNTYTIPRQTLSLAGVPAGTSGYIIWDNNVNRKELDFIYLKATIDSNLDTTQEWIKTKPVSNFDFNDSVFVIGEIVV